jgi:6-phosphogluconolactonase
MSHQRELLIAGSPDDLAREAAGRVVDAAHRAIAERGRFSVALSGGSTPRRLYQLLTLPPYKPGVDWSRVHLFFADERFVPHTHAESTVRLVRETLLAGVTVPERNFHAMPTEGDTPEVCAARYEAMLWDYFGAEEPSLDLVLLGMGPDGHTASLFPGHPVAHGLVACVRDSPKPPPIRLTLTFGAIRAAREVWFLVTGSDKAATLEQVFRSSPEDGDALPAARIAARDGRTLWLVDRQAAASVLDYADS